MVEWERISYETKNEYFLFRIDIRDVKRRLVKSYDHLKPPTAKIAFPGPKGIYFGEMIFPDRKETFKIVKW